MRQLHVPALMTAGKPECRQGGTVLGLSHLPAAIPNQSPARGSSSVVTGGEYPDGECVSVWCDALYLQEYNIHKKYTGDSPSWQSRGGLLQLYMTYERWDAS